MQPRALWWPVHVRETYRYVMGLYARKPEEEKIAVAHLTKGANQWGGLVGLPAASGLMMVHVLGAKGVADGAFGGGPGLVDSSVGSLLSNAKAQTNLYGSSFERFPSQAWGDLFGQHIKETGDYIVALSQKDLPSFGRHFSRVQENMAKLSGFWGSTPLNLRR